VGGDHAAAEAADVIYFALVAATRQGVTLEAIEAELHRRARRVRRRPGDAKPASPELGTKFAAF